MFFSKIKENEIYDSEKLIAERERLTAMLNNHGYYQFGKSYIYFDVDTSMGKDKKVDVRLYIKNLNDSTKHKVYRVRNVFVDANYQIADTLEKKEKV